MGDAAVDQNQLEQIGAYVKSNMAQWIREQNIYPFPSQERGLDKELFERMVTIEQQLKFQNEKLVLMMKQSDEHFEQLQNNMDSRFEQTQNNMNSRFEQTQNNIDSRFEQMQDNMDTRFEQTQNNMDTRFEELQNNIDTRFVSVEKQFTRLYTFLTALFLTMLAGFIPLIIKSF
ncbi:MULTISPECIES: hypothetical protein [unclassified Oceanispirochaeta]|uniref:hypothetical protein n=1 Tax=unclassified Oceanispirochaeta TaxID=2635722 RepID=UPI000E08F724|nr:MULTISPECIES: hypothetical protein [unclassified Oceanispirochaeta]MBF9015956.1 hypothetical protein [Oceanispirochaeta sp. M2]NPD72419.1 hypothetical protein [Oceanispirochaeta sp. M1]RDG32187.1 hypothetical protein DV872_09925 [Oceanispirochaeta sp. M1]